MKKKSINHQKIIDKTPNKDHLKVEMKESEGKGMGVFATNKIVKGEIIAFYRVKVYKMSKYKSPTDFVYSFEVYKKNSQPYKTLISDIYRGSFIDPVTDLTGNRDLNNSKDGYYISYWGPFLNEPNKSKGEKINAEVDLNLQEQYKKKKITEEGDILTYSIVATRYRSRRRINVVLRFCISA